MGESTTSNRLADATHADVGDEQPSNGVQAFVGWCTVNSLPCNRGFFLERVKRPRHTILQSDQISGEFPRTFARVRISLVKRLRDVQRSSQGFELLQLPGRERKEIANRRLNKSGWESNCNRWRCGADLANSR